MNWKGQGQKPTIVTFSTTLGSVIARFYCISVKYGLIWRSRKGIYTVGMPFPLVCKMLVFFSNFVQNMGQIKIGIAYFGMKI